MEFPNMVPISITKHKMEFGNLGIFWKLPDIKIWKHKYQKDVQSQVSPTQLVSPSALTTNGILRWWNLSKSRIIVDSPKTEIKHIKSTSSLTRCRYFLNNYGWAWNLGIFGQSFF